MHISLPSSLQHAVMEKVASGAYPSPEDVISAALQMLFQHEQDEARKLEALREAVRIGEASGISERSVDDIIVAAQAKHAF